LHETDDVRVAHRGEDTDLRARGATSRSRASRARGESGGTVTSGAVCVRAYPAGRQAGRQAPWQDWECRRPPQRRRCSPTASPPHPRLRSRTSLSASAISRLDIFEMSTRFSA
jgi:hypothetical protein